MSRWTTEAKTFHRFLLMSQLDPGAISARIREARDAARLTQQDLADLLEVHKRTIENYENVRAPDFVKLNAVARALNRPVEWFVWGDEVITKAERDEDERELVAKVQAVLDRLQSVEAALVELQQRQADG